MAIKRPDLYEHNNPDLAFVDSTFVRGGTRAVANLTALYALSSKVDQLAERITRVWVASEAKYYVLTNIASVGSSGGWTAEQTAFNLQQITDNGATTTNVITAAGFTTAGNLTAGGIVSTNQFYAGATNFSNSIFVGWDTTAVYLGYQMGNVLIDIGTGVTNKVRLRNTGGFQIESFTGSGTRMLVADSNGDISVQSIPSVPVTSVFGRTGTVTAQSGDYTTAQVTESGNLYYTDARARAALSFAAGSGAYNSTTGVITIPTDNNQIANSAGYITTISGITAGGELSGTYPNPALVTSAVTGKLLTGVNVTGGSISASDSILSAFGKLQNQINGLLGGSIFQSTWNASTNSPSLASGVGTKGYYYIVSTAGSTNLDGITDWQVGDWAIFDGTVWRKVDNTDAVSSVNGFTGAVSLTTSNISEGSGLYYTDARARAAISLTTTGSSGAATYSSSTGVLNIPNYGAALSGYLPLSGGTLTGQLNGTIASFGSFQISAPSNSVSAVFENNSTSFEALQVKNSGSGNIQVWRNNSGIVATMSNSGVITATSFSGAGTGLTGTAASLTAGAVTNGVYTNGSYSDPSWITGLAWSKISGAPAFITLTSLSAGSGISYNNATGVISSTITQYTDSLARAAISAGTGISYNSTTGVVSYSGTVYTDSSIRGLFSAGAGISYNSTTGAISSTITQYTDALARAALSFAAGSGAYNSSTGVITIPTNTNQLTNGAGFVPANGTGATGTWGINISGNAATTSQTNFSALSVSGTQVVTNNGGTWNIAILGNAGTATTATNWAGSSALGSYAYRSSGLAELSGATFTGTVTVNTAIPGIFEAASTANSPTYGGVIFRRIVNTIGNGNGFRFDLYNSSSSFAEYVYLGAVIESNTAGSENGAFIIAPTSGGSRIERFRLTNTGALTVSSSVTATSFFESSDIRKKTIIERYAGSGVDTYKYTFNETGLDHYGYIAQEVEKVLPNAVTTREDGMKDVRYSEVHTFKIMLLENHIERLENRIKQLEGGI